MPESIDNKVVEMTFNNSNFQKNVSDTMSSLEKLKGALNFGGVKNGFADIQKEANKFDPSAVTQGIEGISAKFLAMTTIAATALANITTKVMQTGAQFAKSFTIDPINAGLREYETNMNSIQTILANTESKGGNLETVNAALDQLNQYSDKTIYNFSQMARNIGTFTAAGVGLDASVNAIKGISNLAAISGSNADQASMAMYQLSQALAAGKVNLMDWNSVVNAGMGGEIFKKALFETGKALGTINDVPLSATFEEWEKKGGTFREQMQKGWMTSEVLSTTLQGFSGDLDEAGLRAKGFSEEAAKQLVRLGQLGLAAATEIKTGSQLVSVVSESISSGWAQSFRAIIGDFKQAKDLFTAVGGYITRIVAKNAEARNRVLRAWNIFGGRQALLDGLINAFLALKRVIDPIRFAFRLMFPRTTATTLINISNAIRDFTAKLMISGSVVRIIASVFGTFFSIIKIGMKIVTGIARVIGSFFSAISGSNGGRVTSTLSNITVAISKFFKMLADGEGIDDFFNGIADAVGKFGGAIGGGIKKAIDVVKGFINTIRNAGQIAGGFGEFGSSLTAGFISGLSSGISEVKAKVIAFAQGIIDSVKGVLGIQSPSKVMAEVGQNTVEGFLEGLQNMASAVGDFFKNVFEGIVDGFKSIGSAIGDALASDGFDKVLEAGWLVALSGLIYEVHRLINGGLAGVLTGDLFVEAKRTLKDFGDAINAFALKVKSEALLNVAIALAILTASIIALTFVDAKKVEGSLKTLGTSLAALVAALAILNYTGNARSMAAVGFTVLALAGALVLLSIAATALGKADPDDLAQGLLAMSAVLAALALAMSAIGITSNTDGMKGMAFTMLSLAASVLIMGIAMKSLSNLSLAEIGKGLVGIAGSMLLMVGLMRLIDEKEATSKGIAFLLVAFSLRLFANAIKLFAKIEFTTVLNGLIKIALALTAIGLAMRAFPDNLLRTSLGLIAVSVGLFIIAKVIERMADLKTGDLIKGVLGLVAVLLALSYAVWIMGSNLQGAAALFIVSLGLVALASAMAVIGKMPIMSIVASIVAMTVALTVIGGVAALLGSVAGPAMLMFGGAIMMLGAAVLFAGTGFLKLAQAMEIFSRVGTKGIEGLKATLTTIIEFIPEAVKTVIDAIISNAEALLGVLPQLLGLLRIVLKAIFEHITEMLPSLFELLDGVIKGLIQLVIDNAPGFIMAGFVILMALLEGLRSNIGDIVSAVIEIILAFNQAIVDHLGEITASGLAVLFAFITTLVTNIPLIAEHAGKLLVAFLKGITDNLGTVVPAVLLLLATFVLEVAKNIGPVIDAGVALLRSFADGIIENMAPITEVVLDIIDAFVDNMMSEANITRLLNAGGRLLVQIMNGVANAITENAPKIRNAAEDIVEALAREVTQAGPSILGAAVQGVISGALNNLGPIGDGIRDIFNRSGASQEKKPRLTGEKLARTFASGITSGLDQSSEVDKAFQALVAPLSQIPALVENVDDFNPTITPVLDLSKVISEASKVNGLLETTPIAPDASYAQARYISLTSQKAPEETTPETTTPTEITFTQIINAPEALSTSDIYRGTKSQIALAKEKLGIN